MPPSPQLFTALSTISLALISKLKLPSKLGGVTKFSADSIIPFAESNTFRKLIEVFAEFPPSNQFHSSVTGQILSILHVKMSRIDTIKSKTSVVKEITFPRSDDIGPKMELIAPRSLLRICPMRAQSSPRPPRPKRRLQTVIKPATSVAFPPA